MKKVDILNELWKYLEQDNFIKQYFGQYEEEAKKIFFVNGSKITIEKMLPIYTMQILGWYNDKIKLYYEICNKGVTL